MRKSERIIKITIIVLSVFSITAIILQVINHETGPISTVYEIITFFFAVVALTLAVTQGMYNTKATNELKKIMHELHEIVKMEAAELKYDAILEKSLMRISNSPAKPLRF